LGYRRTRPVRFFKYALLILFSAGITSVAASQTQAETSEFNLDTSLEKAASTATFTYRSGLGIGVESALRFDRQDQVLRLPYVRIQGRETELFVGRGSPGQGRALRLNPARMGIEEPSSSWESRSGSVTVPFLAGIKIGGVRFQSLWSSEEVLDLCGIGHGIALPELAFKAAAMEVSGTCPGIRWSGGLGAARDAGRDSQEGWRAGNRSEPRTELLGLGGSASFKAGPIFTSLWLAASAGSLVYPGTAGALDAVLSWTNAQAGDSEKALKERLTLYFKVSAYGCSRYFRTYLGEKPDLDFSIKMDTAVGFRGLRLWAGFSALSPLEPKGTLGLRKITGKGMESLLWRWRTERLQGLLGFGIGQASLSARGRAGSKGLDKLELLVGYTSRTSRSHPLAFRTALKALFFATSNNQEANPDEESFVTELEESLSDEFGDEENAALRGGLWLSHLRLDTSLAWNKPSDLTAQSAKLATAKGQASAALDLAFTEAGLELVVHAELSQRILLGMRSSLELRLSTPAAGYPVDAMPAEWPEIELNISIF